MAIYPFQKKNPEEEVVELSERPSRRPKDTPLNQQRMKAWQPIFSPKTSIKTFLAVGIVCLAIGAFWIAQNKKIREVRFDYTRCHEIDLYDEPELMPSENTFRHFKASSTGHPLTQWKRSNQSLTFDGITKNYTMCTIDFFLPDDLQPPVLFYYHLTEFHQNHRKYVTSLDKSQLKGKDVSRGSVKDSCFPVTSSGRDGGEEKVIYPCGAIANSIFNDTFADPQRLLGPDADQPVPYAMSRTGIASDLDKELYRPTTYPVPPGPGDNDSAVIVPPPNWAERFPRGYHSGNMFNPAEDEAFMVWMRTAASPSFAKLAMRNSDEVMG
ncbi:LEM3/CDC50 family protein [Colletotrichum tabaci]|uniref:LEM3/CDC50 family protein n=1 Tax=Colletotrichum tabaci TaxID=1209068 RepID=A0AAV9TYZ8_9PEZI